MGKAKMDKEEEKEYKELKKTQDELYRKLTKGFTTEQFTLLSELIDNEIEMEKFCNQ